MSNTDYKHWFLGYDPTSGDEFGNPNRALFKDTPENEVEVLVDGASYMQRLYETIKQTTSGDIIYFAGLELAHDLFLVPDDGFSRVLDVLDRAHKNGVDVRVLLSFHYHLCSPTNVHTFYALWQKGIECVYDISAGSKHSISGAAHQKFVIIRVEGKTHGFCGGIDVTYDRWDTEKHDNGEQRPFVKDFPGGWHDVHTYIQGPACFDLLQSFEERWNFIVEIPDIRSGYNDHERYKPTKLDSSVQPAIPLNGTHHVQILRTYPCFQLKKDEVELPFAEHGEMSARLACLKAIRQAEHLIYIEDQYFYSYEIASALIDALNSKPDLRVLVVVAREPTADKGTGLANYHQGQVLAMIEKGIFDKAFNHFAIYDLNTNPDTYLVENQIYVHAKLMIIDDVWVEIGSMNCNRRSMTHDFEMCVAIVDELTMEATPAMTMGAVGMFAHELRLRLWAHHLGLTPSEVPSDHIIGFEFWATHTVLVPFHARRHSAPMNTESGWLGLWPNVWNSQIDIEGTCPDDSRIPPLDRD